MLSAAPAAGFVPSTDLARSRAFYAGELGPEVVSEDSFALVVRAANLTVRITAVGDSSPVQPFTLVARFKDPDGNTLSLDRKG